MRGWPRRTGPSQLPHMSPCSEPGLYCFISCASALRTIQLSPPFHSPGNWVREGVDCPRTGCQASATRVGAVDLHARGAEINMPPCGKSTALQPLTVHADGARRGIALASRCLGLLGLAGQFKGLVTMRKSQIPTQRFPKGEGVLAGTDWGARPLRYFVSLLQ